MGGISGRWGAQWVVTLTPGVVSLALAVAGCSTAEPGAFPQPPSAKIAVAEVAANLSLPLSGSGGILSANDRARASAFLDAYRDGGRGPMLAVITQPDRASANRAAAMLLALAASRGVSTDALVVSSAIGAGKTVSLHYTDFVAKAPGCAPEIALSFNPTQAVSGNFGCSLEGNIAAMVAHPADLRGPAVEVAADSTRASRTLGLYQTGKATQAEVNRNDSLQLSSVGATK